MMLTGAFTTADILKTDATRPRTPINTVGHGDCRTLLGQIQTNSIDLVISDPSDLAVSQGKKGVTSFNFASETVLRQAMSELNRVLKSGRYAVFFCGKSSPDQQRRIAIGAGFTLVQTLWMERRWFTIKTNINEGREYALVLAKGEPCKPYKLFQCPMPWQYSGNVLHPSQVAIAVINPFIKALSQKGEVVLDPFCGAGSTLCAAKQLKRCYLGIEMDCLYVNRAKRRLSRI